MTEPHSPWRFSVAPMMERTDRHCRYFHRLLTKKTRLYTEMLTTGAVIHGDRQRLLGFDPFEQPVALQLGGADPRELVVAARIGEDFGYSEINLNVGCPSDRVQNGRFGACLMAEPERVADCVAALKAAIRVPVTVKCRLGIDEQDTEESLDRFVDGVVAAGADALVVHARKAWLDGLSPRENRDIPPLDHDRVYRLKRRLPGVPIAVNGGIAGLVDARRHLQHADGVMLGRAAYENPALLLAVDPALFGASAPVDRVRDALENLMPYIERVVASGGRLHDVTRHVLGAFNGRPGARSFRRYLATEAIRPGADARVLRDAIAKVLDTHGETAQTAAA
jgi:tRNA-dihydrouridine synthase A